MLQAAALCGTSIFSSPDATIRVDRMLISANQRPEVANQRPKLTNDVSKNIDIGQYGGMPGVGTEHMIVNYSY